MNNIVIRGAVVSPREVEEFLFRHPKVLDVQVVGVPDPQHGEALCACIVLRPGRSATAQEMRAFCRGEIAHGKVPRYVRFVDGFPLTVMGTVQKFALRERMAAELRLLEWVSA